MKRPSLWCAAHGLSGLAAAFCLHAVPAAAQAGPSGAASDHIVVTARRGEALVASELELSPAEIDTYGAATIGDLVARIAPLTGRPEELPIILVDGKRVDGAAGINGFPPEALARLALLKPEAAARYGYPPGQRVVNLVLKPHFASWQGEAAFGAATAGGRESGQAALGRFVIDGPARWNGRVELSRDAALRRDERPSADSGGSGDGQFYTLLPAVEGASANLALARPLGRFTGTFTLDAGWREQRQLTGRASDSLTERPRALEGRQKGRNVGASALFAGQVAGWQGSLILRYARSWTDSIVETRSGGGSIVPRRGRARSGNLSAQLNLNRTIATLPAGAATANLTLTANRNWSNSRHAADVEATVFRRDQQDVALALAVPLFAAAEHAKPVGDVSVDISAGANRLSGFAAQLRYDVGINWSPVRALQIRATAGFAERAPTLDQLAGAPIEEVRQIYDFRSDRISDVLWILGGNPDLGNGGQHTYGLRITIKPFGTAPITLASEYRRQVSRGGAAPFPAFTPAVEAAFPDRVQRDGTGRLLAIDARPIAIAADVDERLDTSLVAAIRNFGGREKPWRATLSVTHGWLLRSEVRTGAGLPVLDRIDGDIGQSRHSMGVQLNLGRNGLGLTLDGNWQSGYRLRAIDEAVGSRDYRFDALLLTNLRIHVEPSRILSGQVPSWMQELQISADVRNLFDGYRQVRLGDGSRPDGYGRYDADPLGRSVRISLRKRF